MSVLSGVVSPLITPLDEDEKIDIKSLSRMINYVIDEGVNGILLLGTMGEFAAIEDYEKEKLVLNAVEEVKKRIYVFCGIGDCGTKRVIRNAKMIEKYDIDGLVVMLPYPFPTRRKEENRNFLKQITYNCEKPLIYYENPITKKLLDYEDYEWMESQKSFIGVKNSSGDITRMTKLIEIFSKRNGFGIATGSMENMDKMLKLGANGIVPGLSSLIPGICVSLFNSAQNGQWERCYELQQKYNRVTEIYMDKRKLWPGALKTALNIKDIIDNDNVTSPHIRLDKDEIAYVKRILIDEQII